MSGFMSYGSGSCGSSFIKTIDKKDVEQTPLEDIPLSIDIQDEKIEQHGDR